jgi:GH15 family glucan-1,4-alpha-glucosidase
VFQPTVGDYAVVGDCQSMALVSRTGSIDWLCLPRFDSAACFAALLGSPDQGRWLMAPAGEVRNIRRSYRPGTLVLETTFDTDSGSARVVDCMPVRDGVPNLVRLVEGLTGTVRFRCELIIRFDYGSIVPWVRRTDRGLTAIAGPDMLRLSTPTRLYGKGLTSVSEFEVSRDGRIPFVLSWYPSYATPPPETEPFGAVCSTEQWWKEWSGRANIPGPHRDIVLRSLITLKALTYLPTGGVVAAPTASLPERLGGDRNWDYRYCWLRDATFTLYALLNAGYTEEARAWHQWLLRAVAGSPQKTQIMYGLAGERRLTELVLDWLPGFASSRPVRIGNAASEQVQLDVYGEVLDTLYLSRRMGLSNSKAGWRMEKALVEYVAKIWSAPDRGIWEMRGPRRHFTYSKVMAWVAVDRAVKSVERHDMQGPLERWRALRDRIHHDVCDHGFDKTKNSFVGYYGGRDLDAALLRIPLVGFLPPDDPRVQGTVTAIERELMQDGLVQRYPTETGEDGLSPGEGSFVPCSYWLVDNYVLAGRVDAAHALFERLLSLANDVGLLSEEYDGKRRYPLGNFPQAFSHVALVNSARNLADPRGPARHRSVP